MFGMEGRVIGVLFVLTVAVLSVGVLGQQAVSEESEPELTVSSSLLTNASQPAIPETSATLLSLPSSAFRQTFSPKMTPFISSSRHPTSEPTNHADDEDVDPIKSVLLMIIAVAVPTVFMTCLGCCFLYHRFCCWREQRMLVAVLQKEKDEVHCHGTGSTNTRSVEARSGVSRRSFLLRKTSFKIPANDWIGIPIEETIEISAYEKQVTKCRTAKTSAWFMGEEIFEEIKRPASGDVDKLCTNQINGSSRYGQTEKQGIETFNKGDGYAKSDGFILDVGDIPQGKEEEADLLGIEKLAKRNSDAAVKSARSLSKNTDGAHDSNLKIVEGKNPTLRDCALDKMGSDARKGGQTSLGGGNAESELNVKDARQQRRCPYLKDIVQHHIAKYGQSIVSSPVQVDDEVTTTCDLEPARKKVNSRFVLPTRRDKQTSVLQVFGKPVAARLGSLEGGPVDREQNNCMQVNGDIGKPNETIVGLSVENIKYDSSRPSGGLWNEHKAVFESKDGTPESCSLDKGQYFGQLPNCTEALTANELDNDCTIQSKLCEEKMKNKARLREIARGDTDKL